MIAKYKRGRSRNHHKLVRKRKAGVTPSWSRRGWTRTRTQR